MTGLGTSGPPTRGGAGQGRAGQGWEEELSHGAVLESLLREKTEQAASQGCVFVFCFSKVAKASWCGESY